ncbi:MAG TPA: hypothetical protein VK034_04265, partial [Enhygromyxa sp.]|nr:hypothetical protein [Enhygromyxa sp.]
MELELGPLQAFIGPNDSGKSTILRAVAVAVEAALRGVDSIDDPRFAGSRLELQVEGERLWFQGQRLPRDRFANNSLMAAVSDWAGRLHGGTALVRLDPDALRAPSQLIPEGQELGFLTDRGTGLAGLFDALINRS